MAYNDSASSQEVFGLVLHQFLRLMFQRFYSVTLIHIYVLHNAVFLPQIVLDLEVTGEDETSFREHINAITLEFA